MKRGRQPGAKICRWKVEVLLETSLEEAERLISPTTAMLHQVPGGVLMNTYTQTLEWMAHFLVSLRCPLIVREPSVLRDALRAVAAEVTHLSERREELLIIQQEGS